MDRKRVVWTEPARNDLHAIAAYLTDFSPSYATVLVGQIKRAARTLSKFPYRTRIIPEIGLSSVRELLIKDYRLIYKVTDDFVFILGLAHTAQDLCRVLRKINGN